MAAFFSINGCEGDRGIVEGDYILVAPCNKQGRNGIDNEGKMLEGSKFI